MATVACAAGPVSRAVGMGLGVESSGWFSGASLGCEFLLEIVRLVFELWV